MSEEMQEPTQEQMAVGVTEETKLLCESLGLAATWHWSRNPELEKKLRKILKKKDADSRYLIWRLRHLEERFKRENTNESRHALKCISELRGRRRGWWKKWVAAGLVGASLVAPNVSEWRERQLVKRAMKDLVGNEHRTDPLAAAQDYALKGFRNIPNSWLLPRFRKDPRVAANMKAVVLRNLYFQNREVEYHAFRDEQVRVMRARRTWQNKPLFKGRTTLFVANNEMIFHSFTKNGAQFWEIPRSIEVRKRFGSPYRFAPKALLEALEEKSAHLKTIIFRNSSGRTEQDIIDTIVETEGPLTLFFAAHGGNADLHLHSEYGPKAGPGDRVEPTETEETREYGVLAYEELAQAIVDHHIRRHDQEPIIIITNACSSHTYLVNLQYQIISIRRDRGFKGIVPLPIIISPSEYSQINTTDYRNPYGGHFESEVLGLAHEGTPTIGRVINHSEVTDEEMQDFNPSIYVPSEKGDRMQLAQKSAPRSTRGMVGKQGGARDPHHYRA